MRLNKYISDSGYCSRREADKYIAEGRVTINGRDATLRDNVSEGDAVEVDGEKVGRKPRRAVYIAFNKPVGVSSTSDRADKTNIIDFIGYKERIFHVGRLDKDSEGLIILTNDGDIVNKILRAGNNNPKEYVVSVNKPITDDFLKQMSHGVRILGVTTKPCKVFRRNDFTFVIHLTQGLNRQIRRMCHALDYKVVRLKRTKVINIELGNLEPGRWRYFTAEEERDMHAILASSSGTSEASDENKAIRNTGQRHITNRSSRGAKSTAGTRNDGAKISDSKQVSDTRATGSKRVSTVKASGSRSSSDLKGGSSYSDYRRKRNVKKHRD